MLPCSIKSLLLSLFSKSVNEIMSLFFKFVSFVELHPNILKRVLSKELTNTLFEASHNLIDAIHFFYQNQFPHWNFEKLNLHFDFKNKFDVYLKRYFRHSTCRMTHESSNSFIEVTKL